MNTLANLKILHRGERFSSWGRVLILPLAALFLAGCATSSNLPYLLRDVEGRMMPDAPDSHYISFAGGVPGLLEDCSVRMPQTGKWIGRPPGVQCFYAGRAFEREKSILILYVIPLTSPTPLTNSAAIAAFATRNLRRECEDTLSQRIAGFRPSAGGVSFGVAVLDGSRPKYRERTFTLRDDEGITLGASYLTTFDGSLDGAISARIVLAAFGGRFERHPGDPSRLHQVGYLIYTPGESVPATLRTVGERFVSEFR